MTSCCIQLHLSKLLWTTVWHLGFYPTPNRFLTYLKAAWWCLTDIHNSAGSFPKIWESESIGNRLFMVKNPFLFMSLWLKMAKKTWSRFPGVGIDPALIHNIPHSFETTVNFFSEYLPALLRSARFCVNWISPESPPAANSHYKINSRDAIAAERGWTDARRYVLRIRVCKGVGQ